MLQEARLPGKHEQFARKVGSGALVIQCYAQLMGSTSSGAATPGFCARQPSSVSNWLHAAHHTANAAFSTMTVKFGQMSHQCQLSLILEPKSDQEDRMCDSHCIMSRACENLGSPGSAVCVQRSELVAPTEASDLIEYVLQAKGEPPHRSPLSNY